MFTFSASSKAKLIGVHPNLALVISRALLYTPHDFAITEGVRTKARQLELVKLGFSKTEFGKHLIQPDGFAHALDIMAVGDLNRDGVLNDRDRTMTWDPTIYKAIAVAVKRAADELGIKIRWGGDFKSFFDGPHFELIT